MMDGLELQVLVKLGVVLLLIFPALWVLRRLVGAPPTPGWRKAIHVLEVQPLADGQRLYLVRAQGRYLLLGGGKECLSLLTELEAPVDIEAVDAAPPPTWDRVGQHFLSWCGRLPASWAHRLHLRRPETL